MILKEQRVGLLEDDLNDFLSFDWSQNLKFAQDFNLIICHLF